MTVFHVLPIDAAPGWWVARWAATTPTDPAYWWFSRTSHNLPPGYFTGRPSQAGALGVPLIQLVGVLADPWPNPRTQVPLAVWGRPVIRTRLRNPSAYYTLPGSRV